MNAIEGFGKGQLEFATYKDLVCFWFVFRSFSFIALEPKIIKSCTI